MSTGAKQMCLFEAETARSLLDQLLADSRLYTRSTDYLVLLDFVARLRNFAPFNAMLLHVQKPGLSYAASAQDWRARFGRTPQPGARPLLILWPFGPVALVYDVIDTEGDPLPQDVASFFAAGDISGNQLASFAPLLGKHQIKWVWLDAGDQQAGSIHAIPSPPEHAGGEGTTWYQLRINRNHAPPVQFCTLAHELGHLFLGHLGPNKRLNVPKRPFLSLKQRELEAESLAFLVSARNGVASKSETYLARFVDANTTVDQLDLYQLMRAAGQVESLLGLSAHTSYDRPKRGKR